MPLHDLALAYGKALQELETLNEKHATLPERIAATNKVLDASRALKEAAASFYKQAYSPHKNVSFE